MIVKTLNINEVDVAYNPVVYQCYGLGSCIGLFITDRIKKISGGAHIPLALPSSSSENQFRGVSEMVNELLFSLKNLGSDLNTLRAKLAGGAKVYKSSFNIGEENLNTVVEYLVQKKIFIAASHLGGAVARTVQFNGGTGELRITTPDRKMYYI